MNFPVLFSSRLCLREHFLTDSEDYLQLFSNMEAIRYYGREPIKLYNEAEREIKCMRKDFLDSRVVKWAVADRMNDQYLGCVGIKDFKNVHGRGTLSCIIHPDYWGSGYAHEALDAVINYGFIEMGLHRVQAFVDPRNVRAMALFDNLGFTLEAILKEYEFEHDEYISIAIFGLIDKKA